MNKPRSSKAGIPNFLIVGFALVVLWSGFICFTFMTFTSIGAGTDYSYSSAGYSPTTLNIELMVSKQASGRTQATDNEQSLGVLITAINLFPADPAKVDDIDSLYYFELLR